MSEETNCNMTGKLKNESDSCQLTSGSFTREEVTKIVMECIEKTIGKEVYKHSDVGNWNNAIVENVILQLVDRDSHFKYIVSCAIVQKNGAGLNTATNCYWDSSRDQHYQVRWENKHLHCIVFVFAMPL